MPDIFLANRQALGDAVMMTALVRDLSLAGYIVGCWTGYNHVFKGNPYRNPNIYSGCGLMYEARWGDSIFKKCESRRQHLIQYMADEINALLPSPVSFQTKPDLYCESPPLIEGEYVAIANQATCASKRWPYWQRLIDSMPDVRFVQVGKTGAMLERCESLIGRTSVYDLVNAVRYAQAVVCPITSVMHIAAAFDVPQVVVANGREHPSIFAYDSTAVVSTLGSLPCCQHGGCYLFDNCVDLKGGYPSCASSLDAVRTKLDRLLLDDN